MTKEKKCICADMQRNNALVTFECPMHGTITIDTRFVYPSYSYNPYPSVWTYPTTLTASSPLPSNPIVIHD